MKSNLTLIGMPGAGKSTIGIILAKNLGLGFLDTDVLIQINQQKTLQQIMDESGYLHLRKIEEGELVKINLTNHIISTGGSVVYSDIAMTHLKAISTVIFLEASFDVIQTRIRNFETRGIAKGADQTFLDLYHERQVLYQRYADITVDCNSLDQDGVAARIAGLVNL